MKKLIPGAAAVALALLAAGCSTSAPTGTTPGSAASTTSGQAPSSAPGATDASTTPATATVTPGSAAPAAPVDQSTPDAVMTGWLTAMVNGDSGTVCGLMAANGTAIEDLPEAKDQCAKAVAPMLQQLTSVKDMFKGLKVEGATVKGNTATFGAAKTTPVMAASIIKNLKAVNLKGKWYVTQS